MKADRRRGKRFRGQCVWIWGMSPGDGERVGGMESGSGWRRREGSDDEAILLNSIGPPKVGLAASILHIPSVCFCFLI